MYNQGLFKDWVPKPAMLLLIILYLFPLLVVGGIYTANLICIALYIALYEWDRGIIKAAGPYSALNAGRCMKV